MTQKWFQMRYEKTNVKNTLHVRLPLISSIMHWEKEKGNDGNMYVSKMSLNYGPTIWVKA